MGKQNLTAGCSDDLIQATNLAYKYILQLGLDDKNLITK